MTTKSINKIFISLAVFSTACSTSSLSATTPSTSKGFFQPRAASANIGREMLMEPGAHHRSSDSWYGEFSGTAFYQHSWNQNSDMNNTGTTKLSGGMHGLGTLPFWSGTNFMTVGSNSNASTTASTVLANVDAYQFGLGPVTTGTTAATIALNPIVYQAGADFMFIVGSCANGPGFYAKFKAPLSMYNIDPQLTQPTLIDAVDYPQGSLAVSSVTTYSPAQSMEQAFKGAPAENGAQQTTIGGPQVQGDYTPMKFGLINGQQSTGATFGDIEMTMGYNFVSDKDNALSIAARASAPTGNKATGVYMLEPIVGRGGNWGLGGYTAGHVKIWEGTNGNRFSFKFMADVMHLFITDTVRSYDLIENGGGSRYLLVADYGATGVLYQNTIQNLINYTTLASQSSFGVEADIALACNYAGQGWTIDFGYEFFGRSEEKLVITGDFKSGQYAILGRQGVGELSSGGTPLMLNQPTATISSSVDRLTSPYTPTAVVTTVTQATNVQLVDLDVQAAQQGTYLSSKVFTKLSYEWVKSDYAPFLGMMGEFEWSSNVNNALPQWSIVLVGGVSF